MQRRVPVYRAERLGRGRRRVIARRQNLVNLDVVQLVVGVVMLGFGVVIVALTSADILYEMIFAPFLRWAARIWDDIFDETVEVEGEASTRRNIEEDRVIEWEEPDN